MHRHHGLKYLHVKEILDLSNVVKARTSIYQKFKTKELTVIKNKFKIESNFVVNLNQSVSDIL